MDSSYESITEAAISTIEAMAREPRDTVVCNAESVRAVAVGVYWSWARLVGRASRREDSDLMERLIRSMPQPGRS